MIPQVAYYQIFGLSVIAYVGILTILSFIATASIPILNRKFKLGIDDKWHGRLAYVGFGFALLHVFLVI